MERSSVAGSIRGLSADRRELLQRLRQAQRGSRPGELQRVERQRHHPLSYAQRRYWFLDQLDPGNPSHHLANCYRLTGPLDLPAMRAAVHSLVRRHEVLRTAFPVVAREPVQRPEGAVLPQLRFVDLTEIAEAERVDLLQAEVQRAVGEPFPLATGPVLRVLLVRVHRTEHVLALVVHHIASDGWSMGLLRHELAQLYREHLARQEQPEPGGAGGAPGPLSGAAPPYQYVDFAAWQEERLDLAARQRHLLYWKSLLANPPDAFEPATDRPRPPGPPRAGGLVEFRWPAELLKRVKALAAGADGTPYMALLAGFAVLLHRYSGQSDLVIGTPVANRTGTGVEQVVGPVSNTLPVRVRVPTAGSYRQLLRQVRQVSTGFLAHSELPFDLLVRELGLPLDTERNPLFQVMFQLLTLPDDERPAFAGTSIEPFPCQATGAAMDLDLLLAESGGELLGMLTYNADIFDRTAVQAMVDTFRAIMADACGRPDAIIHQLDVHPEPPRAGALLGGSGEPAGPSVPELIGEVVRQSPDRVLVSGPDGTLTAAGLWRAAGRLAARLVAAGVQPGEPVGVSAARGAGLVVAVLGVWRAGAALVPLDPAFPLARLRYAADDAGIRVVLVDPSHEHLIAGWPVATVRLDRAAVLAGGPARLPAPPTTDSLAYLIYTSGSTGNPKGIAVSHRNLASFVASMLCRPGLAAGDVMVAVTTLSFDISLLELVAPLCAGAQVAVVDLSDPPDGRRLAQQLEDYQATIMQGTPATWQLLLASGWPGRPGMRALVGGEALPAELAWALLDRSDEVWNLYGPTEATVWATTERLSTEALSVPMPAVSGPAVPAPSGSVVPIGEPIDNTRTWLVSGRGAGAAVPRRAAGELVLGGSGIAWGYWGRPGLTAERFVPDPSGPPGARAYRTGDMARVRADGGLEFLGRQDNQVKLRGFRIELGEIEAVLARHPAVAGAAAAVVDEQVVAYLVAATGGAPPALAELRTYAGDRLPHYMLPGAVVTLGALPLTPNGKLDRRALAVRKPAAAMPVRLAAAPRTARERQVAGVWQEILEVETVGLHDSFLDLGGNSLRLAVLRGRLEETLEVQLDIVDLFRHPTIAAFLDFLDAPADRPNHRSPDPGARSRGGARLAHQARSRSRGGRSRPNQEVTGQ